MLDLSEEEYPWSKPTTSLLIPLLSPLLQSILAIMDNITSTTLVILQMPPIQQANDYSPFAKVENLEASSNSQRSIPSSASSIVLVPVSSLGTE